MIRRSAVLFVLAICAAVAQHPAAPPTEKPVALIAGLGTWHHPIATRSAEAQKFFDQGLNLIYGFNRYEALRSFRKASELDPQAAMPWWGVAMALGPHINMDFDGDVDIKAACEAAATGLRIDNAPAVEKAYLGAVMARCPVYKPDAYIEAMCALTERVPDDLDASTFYAESLLIPTRWRWYSHDGKPAAGVSDAEHVLEQVLRRYAEHPGANHLYIHAVESSGSPERAVASAQRLMGIVPAAGHLVHMPGHIWMVLGDYETVANVNERAVSLDQRYLEETGVSSSYAGYLGHNLDFLLAARWMQRNVSKALHATEALVSAMAPMADAMPDMMDPFLSAPLMTQARFGLWEEVLKATPPSSKFPISIALYHHFRAIALAARGNHAGALEEQRSFEAARAKVPADRQWGTNTAGPMLAMVSEIVAGRVAGSPAEAVPHWQRAVATQDALVYNEPPDWYCPLRESLGAALLRAGQAPQAELVFREGLRRSPHNGRMLFGLLESLKAQNKTMQAG